MNEKQIHAIETKSIIEQSINHINNVREGYYFYDLGTAGTERLEKAVNALKQVVIDLDMEINGEEE